jgi:DNA-binding response OmpR family regulator
MSTKEKILVADDEEDFLYPTAKLLEKHGYACECATDSETADKLLAKEKFSLLIADIKMPGNSDLEFIQHLPEKHNGLPVILITGHPDIFTAIKALQLPVVSYMIKPFDYDLLVTNARNAINSYKNYVNFETMAADVKELADKITELKQWQAAPALRGASMPISAFASLNLTNIANSARNLSYLLNDRETFHTDGDVCQMVNCPKLRTLVELILEATEVLEKTRSSFKSKDIGQLRKKMLKTVEDLYYLNKPQESEA